MKKNKSGKGYAFPFGRFQRGGLRIVFNKKKILKELTLFQKILFLLGLRPVKNAEDMERRISNLATRLAYRS